MPYSDPGVQEQDPIEVRKRVLHFLDTTEAKTARQAFTRAVLRQNLAWSTPSESFKSFHRDRDIKMTFAEATHIGFVDKLRERFQREISAAIKGSLSEEDIAQLVHKVVIMAKPEFERITNVVTTGQRIATTLVEGVGYAIAQKNLGIFGQTLLYCIFHALGAPVVVGTITSTLVISLSRCISYQLTKRMTTEGPSSEELDAVSEVLTAIWQMISIGKSTVSEKPASMKAWCSSVFEGIGKVSSKSRSLLLFFNNLVSVVRRMYTFVMDKVFGVTPAINLVYREDVLMRRWTMEANTLLDPSNEIKVIDDPKWFARLAAATFVADYIAIEVNRAGVRDLPPMLMSLRKDLRSLKNKSVNLGFCTAFRPEPVCVWISGPPGLSKTYMKTRVIATLLSAARVKVTGNDVFGLSSDQDFWTGAVGKAVIYYDDFVTVETPTLTPTTLALFMQLISTARFSPTQSDTEDKGKALAPCLVYVNCNESTPLYNEIRSKDAFLRRRHICLKAVHSPAFIQAFKGTSVSELTLETAGAKDWVKTHSTPENLFPHARYCFVDPMNGKSLGGFMTYEQTISYVRNQFVLRFKENYANYLREVASMTSVVDEDMELPLQDVVRLVIRKITQGCNLSQDASDALEQRWKVPDSFAEEARKQTTSWLHMFSEVPNATTEAGQPLISCTCDVGLLTSLTVENDKLIWTSGDQDGEEYIPILCSDHCVLGTPNVILEFKRDLSSYPDFADVLEKLIDALEKLQGRKGATSASQKKKHEERTTTPSDATATSILGELRSRIPFKDWSPQATQACLTLASIALFVGGAFTLFRAYKWYVGDSEQPVGETIVQMAQKTELFASGDNHTSRIGKVKGIAIKRIKTEGFCQTEASLSVTEIVDRNICYLVLDGRDIATGRLVEGFTFRCYGLAGTWILLLKHYVEKIKRTDVESIRFINASATVSRPIKFNLQSVRYMEDSEFCLYELPKQIHMFKDIRAHLQQASETDTLKTKAIVYEKALGKMPILTDVSLMVQRDFNYDDVISAGNCVTHTLPAVYMYGWHGSGRCMTPVIGHVRSGMKICGFHMSGGNGKGAAEPVVRESFDFINAPLTTESAHQEWLAAKDNARLTLNGDFIPEGVVKPSYAANPARKTAIIPSNIHNYVPPTTVPAPLLPEHVDHAFSPLITGVQKHGEPPLGFPQHLLDRAEEALLEQYQTSCVPVRVDATLLTEEQAVVGIPGLDGYQGMEMSTSEGFPYMATRPAGEKNKRYLFDIEDGVLRGVNPQLRGIMDAKEALRSAGVVPFTVFTDCLKDARIPREKFLLPGKTRIFSISPADFTIQFRMYFGDILASQKACRFNLEHMVGMNVFSLEWTALARRIQEKGPKVLCGDYSNFGPGLDSEVVFRVGRVWRKWYQTLEANAGVPSEEICRRDTVRACMIEEMRHSVHQCQDILYRVLCGSPSGAPPTVHINNDCNKFYIYMAWLDCWKDNPLMATMVAFRKHVAFYVYGDDLICNVSDEAITRFNNVYLQSFFATYGIKYTDDTKGSDIRPYCSLMEATFLKGSFRKNENHSYAFDYALSKKSIEDCANWMHTSPDALAATRQAICDSLMLAFGQGKEYFEAHRSRLLKAWREQSDEPIELYTYPEMDTMRYGSVEDPHSLTIQQLLEKEREFRLRLKRELEAGDSLTPLMSVECVKSIPNEQARQGYKLLLKKLFALRRQGVKVSDVQIRTIQDIIDHAVVCSC
uniref:Polyprotein n=1 Tax=Lygus hesperus TaxID=30085 RepID=A0A0K8TC00_LYGHE